MFTLIKNANLYSPEHLGMNDVLLADDKIALIDRKIELTGIPFDTIDAGGCAVTPGFIDQHVHIIGGGGQTGYASLVPDVSMSELVACGTTTVVGLLGTDGFVKELTTLYAKTKALEDNGLSAYMLTSFYGLPPRTLMSCVADDLIFIDKVIGCKLAMSDDTAPHQPSTPRRFHFRQRRYPAYSSGSLTRRYHPVAGHRPQISHADSLSLAYSPDTHGSLILASRRICLHGWYGRFLHRRNQIRRSPSLRHESPRSPCTPRPHHLLQ